MKACLVSLLLSCVALTAQTTVSTPIVGFQKTALSAGLNAFGVPLLNPDIVKTATTTLSGNSLGLSGQTNLGALLAAGEPYYLEVYSGGLTGDRFDVDTAATKTAANGAVVLSSASLNNTISLASVSTNLDGVTVAIRKHITLEQIQSFVDAPMTGSNVPSSADQIQLFNNSTGLFMTYYLRADGVTWRGSTTGTAVQNKVTVPPGTGVFLKKAAGTANFVSTGSVRDNDFALPFKAGLQLLAPGYPISYSPVALGGSTANGWTGNNTPSSADQIQILNSGGASFTTYYLRADGTSWRSSSTGTLNQASNSIISDAGAFFVRRATANLDNVLIDPVQ
jgi:hypothetical protein